MGTLLGATTSLSNAFGSPYNSPHSLRPLEGVFFLEVLAAVVGTAWFWALVAFGLGWWGKSKWSAPIVAVTARVVASCVYYLCDFTFGVNERLEIGEVCYWMLMSSVVGSVLGLTGHLARSVRWWSLLPGLSAPGLV